MVEIATTRSRCILRAFPYKKRILPYYSNNTKIKLAILLDTQETMIDSGIVSCSIIRDKSNFSASFSVTLKLLRDYTNLLKPGDWVLIYLDKADQLHYDWSKSRFIDNTNHGLKLIGNIDRVSTSKIVDAKGTIIRTCRIDGRDVGKIFDKTQIFFNPYDPPEAQLLVLHGTGVQLDGTPRDYIEKYLDLFLGKGSSKVSGTLNAPMLHQMLLPPAVFRALKGDDRAKTSITAFYDILRKDFEAVAGWAVARDIGKNLLTNIGESVRQGCNPALNEIYLDTKYVADQSSVVPVLTLRQIPMTKAELVNLAKRGRTLQDRDIVVDDLGFSDHERYNYVIIRDAPNITPDVSYLASVVSNKIPAIFADSIQRYGLNRVDRMTEYSIVKTAEGEIDYGTIITWANRISDYWLNYHRYETGTIVVHNMSHFEVGEIIKITDRDRMYMVEGYTIEWNYLEAITTSLQVTHGMKLDGSFIEEEGETPNVERSNSTSFIPEKGIVDPGSASNKLYIEKD